MFSAYCFFDEGGDFCLFGAGQFGDGEGGWPHIAFVEIGSIIKAERRVSIFELRCVLEKTDDLAVAIGIRRHPIPSFRGEGWVESK